MSLVVCVSSFIQQPQESMQYPYILEIFQEISRILERDVILENI